MRTRTCALALGLLAALLTLGCARSGDAPVASDPAPGAAVAPVPVTAPTAPATDRGSLYDLDVALDDHADRDIKLDVDRGRVVVVSMFYSSCPAACPTLIADLKKIDAQLTEAERSEVRVLLVSMDRDKDSPESFRELAELHALDLSRWTLAEPEDEADVRAIAAALNIKYRKLPDGNISHSSIITILRPDGGLDLAVEGLGRDNADIVARLRGLVATKG